MRDSCYGVICTLSRYSNFISDTNGYIFSCGKGFADNSSGKDNISNNNNDNNGNIYHNGSISIDTAKLLFGCATYEQENLRPRAVAALDALLNAYCNVYKHNTNSSADNNNKIINSDAAIMDKSNDIIKVDNNNSTTSDNPWSNMNNNGTSNGNSNPWSNNNISKITSTTTTTGGSNSSSGNNDDNNYVTTNTTTNKAMLSKALLPILWKFSQSTQSKASRLCVARWSSDLLKELDLINACHILCFLAGDEDVTASAIAREGLNLPKHTHEELIVNDDDYFLINTNAIASTQQKEEYKEDSNNNNHVNGGNITILPDFSDLVSVLFQNNDHHRHQHKDINNSNRATYWEFPLRGKATALRFGLICLLNDMYVIEEDNAIETYLFALTETISMFFKGGANHNGGSREVVDLLDDSSRCLSATLGASIHARKQLLLSSLSSNSPSSPVDAHNYHKNNKRRIPLCLKDIESLVLSASSSLARRHFAKACGNLYDDISLWKTNEDEKEGNGEGDHFHSFIIKSQINHTLELCASKLINLQHNHFKIGEIHGAAFLGAQCIRAFRLQAIQTTTSSSARATNKAEEESSSFSDVLSSCWENASKILSALGNGTMHSDEIIGNAFADSLAIALSYEKNIDIDATTTTSNSSNTNAPILEKKLYEGTTSALNHLNLAILKFSNLDHCNPPRASKLAHAAGIILAASTSGAGYVAPSSSDDSCINSNSSNIDIDATATPTTNCNLGPARLKCADSLFFILGSPAFRKDEEIALVAGEALGNYADAYGAENVTWNSSTEWPQSGAEEYSEAFAANAMPPHQQVLYILIRKMFTASSPHKRTACAPALLAVVGRAARGVNSDTHYSNRALVKEIVEHLNEIQDVFIKLLADPKSKHLSRESCCLGLAACRGLAKAKTLINAAYEGARETIVCQDEQNVCAVSDELNYRLLRAFGQTTNFGGSAYQESRAQAAERRQQQQQSATTTPDDAVESTTSMLLEPFGQEEREVGGASGMGEAALGAYREMASAAVSLGRPDVLYALLILAVSHPVWFTAGPRERYSSSSLLGEDSIVGSRTNSAEMRAALRPHLGKLLPRILRACNDPNKQTREQMASLWVSLTGGGTESRVAITEHLLPTIDVLLEDASSKLWRARVGACGALSEILVGRLWDDLGGGPAVLNDDDVHNPVTTSKDIIAGIRLLRLWRVATRALDDVRGAVRESGEGLARTVRALTIRLCDPSLPDDPNGKGRSNNSLNILKHERDASSAAATSLRWLIRHGLSQPCPEAAGFCVSCLVGIVDVVRPSILQPLIPGLLRSLLFAMSGLEPSAFNYLQVRTAGDGNNSEGYDRLERLRLQMAQSGPLASAIVKCLGMLPHASIDTQKEVIPELDASLRLSAGFATRAATADAVSTLCATCPNAFRFPGSSNTNPSVRLLRALYFASERERGQAARDKMTHALGNLAALCPGASVRSMATKACEKYNASTGNNDDPASRRAAAAALRAVAVRASDQFTDGGPSNVWCRRVLPVAFLGQKDSDTKVANLWKEVWDEGGSAANLSSRTTAGSSADDFGSTIQELLLPYLVKECAKALEDVSWSRRVAGSAALVDLCNIEVLSPPPQKASREKSGPDPSLVVRARRRSQASSAALNACIKLLTRSRLWTGKSEVLNAAVRVAAKWACPVADCSPDELILFGWDEKPPCPWQPIAVSPGHYKDDLIIGDNWFAKKDDAEIVLEAAVDCPNQDAAPELKRMDIDDVENDDVKIDFEECDKTSENEGAAEEEEKEQEELSADTVKSNVVTFAGFCRFLIEEAIPPTVRKDLVHSEEFLPYRASAFGGFRDLMACLSETQTSVEQKKDIYFMLSHKLIEMFDTEHRFKQEKLFDKDAKETHVLKTEDKSSTNFGDTPPLLIARAIDCLAESLWVGIGSENNAESIATTNVLELTRVLRTAGGKLQPAWTVREASCLCVASIASKCHQDALRQYTLISTMIECAAQALKDRKFWRVRLSGVKLLHELVSRVGHATASRGTAKLVVEKDANSDLQKRQLLLDAMLPHKEEILKLTRSSLSDPEAKVTALSSSLLSTMSWWP